MVRITLEQFKSFIEPKGFRDMTDLLDGVFERVFGKVVTKNNRTFSIRVYSSIEGGVSRDVGEDAIRVEVWERNEDGTPVRLGGAKRVNRTPNWRKNLAARIDTVLDKFVEAPMCDKCGSPMALREPKRGQKWKPFYGCSDFPHCENKKSID